MPLAPLFLNLQLHLPQRPDVSYGDRHPGPWDGPCLSCPGGPAFPSPTGHSDGPFPAPMSSMDQGPLSPLDTSSTCHLTACVLTKGLWGGLTNSRTPNIQIIIQDKGTHSHTATLAQTLSGDPGVALWNCPSQSPAVTTQTFEARLQARLSGKQDVLPIQVWRTR